MNDISDFHPFMQEALRTGKLPSDDEIARAIGENPSSIRRLRERLETEPTDSRVDSPEPEKHDQEEEEERFRQKYRQLVDDMIAEWYDDNPHAGNSIPPDERQRIETYCERQIQHEWRMRQKRLTEEQDT
ncbi:hypothetical protein [Mycobacterium sp. MUNTM1]